MTITAAGRHMRALRSRLYLSPMDELPLDRPDVREALERDAAENGPHGDMWTLVHAWIDADRERVHAWDELTHLTAFLMGAPVDADGYLWREPPGGGRQGARRHDWEEKAAELRRSWRIWTDRVDAIRRELEEFTAGTARAGALARMLAGSDTAFATQRRRTA